MGSGARADGHANKQACGHRIKTLSLANQTKHSTAQQVPLPCTQIAYDHTNTLLSVSLAMFYWLYSCNIIFLNIHPPQAVLTM
jgi:hypothetical protein